MITSDTLRGVIPAIPTPFTSDGSAVDEDALRRVVSHVVDGGVHGIMTTGGTGEFPHLSREERRRVNQVTVEVAAGAATVYAGTAACLDPRGNRTRSRRRVCRGRRGDSHASILFRYP